MRLLFWGLEKSFALDPIFPTVSDVPSRPCSPDVQRHSGHSIHSGHLNVFLNITARDCWAIAGRQCVSAPQNVAQHQHHRSLTTHPKLILILFCGPCVPSIALFRRRRKYVCIPSAFDCGVVVSLYNSSRKLCPASCFWCRHQIAPSLLLPPRRKETGESGQTNTCDR